MEQRALVVAVTKENTSKGHGGGDERGGGEESREMPVPESRSKCHLVHTCDEVQVWVEPDASYYAIDMRGARVRVGQG